MNKEEMKTEPCLRCGGTVRVWQKYAADTQELMPETWHIKCNGVDSNKSCLYMLGWFSTEAEAIAAHNEIACNQKKAARVDKLVACMKKMLGYKAARLSMPSMTERCLFCNASMFGRRSGCENPDCLNTKAKNLIQEIEGQK